MTVLLRTVAGLLLIAHGLVHLLFLAPDVEEFKLWGSWLVSGSASRPVGVALMAAAVAAFALLGLAVWGVPSLSDGWPAITIAASVASLALLIVFWGARLVFGVTLFRLAGQRHQVELASIGSPQDRVPRWPSRPAAARLEVTASRGARPNDVRSTPSPLLIRPYQPAGTGRRCGPSSPAASPRSRFDARIARASCQRSWSPNDSSMGF